jgi:hypothetical protein
MSLLQDKRGVSGLARSKCGRIKMNGFCLALRLPLGVLAGLDFKTVQTAKRKWRHFRPY